LHVVDGKLPVLVIVMAARTVWPAGTVTIGCVLPLRDAGTPTRCPTRLTAETPGKPWSVQACAEMLVNCNS